jgi:hypothetical protein
VSEVPLEYPEDALYVESDLSHFTGVPHLQENTPSQDPTLSLFPGLYGGSRGVGVFFWARYPYTQSNGLAPRGGLGIFNVRGTPAHSPMASHGHFAEQVPGWAYCGSSNKFKDLQGYLIHKKNPPSPETTI